MKKRTNREKIAHHMKRARLAADGYKRTHEEGYKREAENHIQAAREINREIVQTLRRARSIDPTATRHTEKENATT